MPSYLHLKALSLSLSLSHQLEYAPNGQHQTAQGILGPADLHPDLRNRPLGFNQTAACPLFYADALISREYERSVPGTAFASTHGRSSVVIIHCDEDFVIM